MKLLIAITINLFGTRHNTNVYDLFFTQSSTRGKYRFGHSDPNTYQIMGVSSSILEKVYLLLHSYHQQPEALPLPMVIFITEDDQGGIHYYLRHPEPYWMPSLPGENPDDFEADESEIARILTGQQLSSEQARDFFARMAQALER